MSRPERASGPRNPSPPGAPCASSSREELGARTPQVGGSSPPWRAMHSTRQDRSATSVSGAGELSDASSMMVSMVNRLSTEQRVRVLPGFTGMIKVLYTRMPGWDGGNSGPDPTDGHKPSSPAPGLVALCSG